VPRPWNLALEIARDGRQPPFLQIARALTEAIRRGRLRPGDPIPGSRRLAASLDVHRNTVLAAIAELVAQGWLETTPARGTFVARSLPPIAGHSSGARAGAGAGATADAPAPPPARAGFSLAEPPEDYRPPRLRPGTLDLSHGAPDARLVPARAIGRAWRRAMTTAGRRLLAYGDPEGHPALRAALAAMLSSTRGLAIGADDLVVTRGSQMALTLVARALVRPGDVVAVEDFGYRPAWEAFRGAGAIVRPVPVDRDGLDVAALRRLAARGPLRAVYVTPHHQYPTTVTLKAARRLDLLAFARAARTAVVEDDYDHEFHYAGRPVLPLAAADPAGVVIHVGTLSKTLAPGLRIGYVTATRPVVAALAAHRSLLDLQGDLATEAAVAALIEDGELQRHVARVRRIYAARREVLAGSLSRTFGEEARFDLAPGGMAIWVRFRRPADMEAWARRGLTRGVSWYTGRRYAFDGRPKPYARLSFAWLDEREIPEAVRRMAAALPGGRLR
jgi:GntR family transcriptional regulator/MocR family aminotransferase